MYVGPFETEDSCREWKEEYDLTFPVVPDEDGALFQRFTSGWVPWSILVGPDGEVLFSENGFDETGFSSAIAKLFDEGTDAAPTAPESTLPTPRARRAPDTARRGRGGGADHSGRGRPRSGPNGRDLRI